MYIILHPYFSDTRDPNAPAAVTYIPVYDDSEDALFSNTKLNTGINFKKYRDIPVKVTGPGHEMVSGDEILCQILQFQM